MTAFSFSDLRIKSMQIKGERPLIVILSSRTFGRKRHSHIPQCRQQLESHGQYGFRRHEASPSARV